MDPEVRVLLMPSATAGTIRWLAQCLDVDIAADGETVQEAIYEIERALWGYNLICTKRGIDPHNVGRAPKRFWDMYERSHPITPPERPSFHYEEGAADVPEYVLNLKLANQGVACAAVDP